MATKNMKINLRSFFIVIFLSLSFSCTEKAKLSSDPASREGQMLLKGNGPDEAEGDFKPSFRVQQEVNSMSREGAGPNVGVFYMPSWDAPSGGKTRDIFWACLQGKEYCPFLMNPAFW